MMAARFIREGTAECGRYVEAREITEAIGSAARIAETSGVVSLESEPRFRAWPAANLEQVEAIAVNGVGLAGLETLSPMKFEGDDRHTEAILDSLFQDHELVCVGSGKKTFTTRTRSELRGQLSSLPFIVPSC
jgi:hypothetical protein